MHCGVQEQKGCLSDLTGMITCIKIETMHLLELLHLRNFILCHCGIFPEDVTQAVPINESMTRNRCPDSLCVSIICHGREQFPTFLERALEIWMMLPANLKL
jgi:hypothetical protein